MDENSRNRYNRIMLDVFKAFDAFCTAKGLDYFAAGGTALGAVRHKGFIPWDDDIDVYMLRKDYERFLSLRSELPEPYKVLALGDKGCIYPFAKMYDGTTKLVEVESFPECRIGVFIDIFPLDEVSGSFEEIAARHDRDRVYYDDFIRAQRKFSLASCRKWLDKGMHKTIFYSLLPAFLKRRQIKKFLAMHEVWKNEKGDRLKVHFCVYTAERETYEKEWFTSWHYVPFEDTQIRICDHYDEYLTRLFGDYMTPPPPEKRTPHHNTYSLEL